MSVKVEKVEKNVVQLEIEVDAAKFEEGMQKSYTKNAKKFNIHGFRKGKAPRKVIERQYGEQVFFEDAIDYVRDKAYAGAVEESNIKPVDWPKVDIKQIGSGQNLIFTARVTVKPEVELGEYKDVEVNRVEVDITDEDVNKEIERLQEKNSRLVKVEDRPVQSGDSVTMDYDGFIDDAAFEGGKGINYNLVIGSGQFIPGFEDQLIGKNAGDEAEVNVNFPEEYHNSEVAGKPAMFKIKINDIRFKELPALDDEFAKDVSEFNTLDELKEDTRKKLAEKAEKEAKEEQENRIVKKITDAAVAEIPEVMINKQIDSIVKDYDMRLRYQGLDINKYLEYSGRSMDNFREQFKERAQDEVKTHLVLEKIKEIEGIESGSEEVEKEIARLAENYGNKSEDFKKHLRDVDIEYIKGNLEVSKTIDFLVENAKMV